MCGGQPLLSLLEFSCWLLCIGNPNFDKIHPSATVTNKLQYASLILLANSLFFLEPNFYTFYKTPASLRLLQLNK